MAQLTTKIYSESLSRYIAFTAIIPTSIEGEILGESPIVERAEPRRTLYLLHGWTGNHEDWLTRSNVSAYAQKYNIAIILPSGENSFYVDHPSGASYGEFIGQELIKVTRELFPLSHKREDTWIAGLSMGGYGALRNGFYYSETFSQVAAFSSAILSKKVDSPREMLGSDPIELMIKNSMGIETLADLPPENNPYQLVVDRQHKQALYIACGQEDELLEENKAFHEYLLEKEIPHEYTETPGGHEWSFWDTQLEKAIKWMVDKDI